MLFERYEEYKKSLLNSVGGDIACHHQIVGFSLKVELSSLNLEKELPKVSIPDTFKDKNAFRMEVICLSRQRDHPGVVGNCLLYERVHILSYSCITIYKWTSISF